MNEKNDEVERFVSEWRRLNFFEKSELTLSIVGIAVVIIYTIYTAKMYDANYTAANAAKSAATTAANQLELAERPWIFIKDAKLVRPLVFDVNGASTELQITLRNSGPSPAVNVLIHPILYRMPSQEGSEPPVEKICHGKGGKFMPLGMNVFPGDSPPQNFIINISKEDLLSPDGGANGIVVVTPIICVAYRSTFNTRSTYFSGIQYPCGQPSFLQKCTLEILFPLANFR